jgi:multiple sugar transport system ATP-binding protein
MNFLEGAPAAQRGAKTIGIRPEHIVISTSGGDWKGTVGVAEHLGADTFLHVHADGLGTINVRADGEIAVNHGDTVYLSPQPDKVHRFSPDGRAM